MQAAKLLTEEARLAALYEYDILDKPAEQEFEDVTRLLSRMCEMPIALITLVDKDRQFFLSAAGVDVRETPLNMSICAHAILQPGLFVVSDTLNDPRFADNPLVSGDPHLRYYAGALLETSDGYPIGTLCVLDYQPRMLTDDQKDLIQVLARQVMKQLELRRLVNAQTIVLNERNEARQALAVEYEREKRIAETLQRSLLMDEQECCFSGIEIIPRYEAAWAESIVGGDFYDMFGLDEDQVALVVGDVAGKGLDAAARTAEVKYALRAFLQEHPQPAQSLDHLNDFLCNFHTYAVEDTVRFVAVSVAVLNVRTGEARFANAGAEPVIFLHEDGTSSTTNYSGMPLGIESGTRYQSESFALEAGDLIVLATDGIAESRRSGEFLGTEGFIKILKAELKPNLSEWADSSLQAVKAYTGGTLHDDVCVVMARLRS